MRAGYNFWKNRKNVFFLFLLYLPAHFLLLASKARMWDGYLWGGFLKQKNYEMLYQALYQGKILYMYAIYRIIDWLGDPVIISNISVFISWLIAGICVYYILKNFTRIGEKNAFFVAALFLLSPIYVVRFEMSLVPYSLSNAAFFLGAYAFLRAGTAMRLFSRIVLRALAAVFFMGAFLTASFIVFYGAFIIFAFFIFLKKSAAPAEAAKPWTSPPTNLAKQVGGGASALYIFVKKNIFWILLPVIFYWAQQKVLSQARGADEGYNCLLFFCPGTDFFSALSNLINQTYQFIVYGFFWPIFFSFSVLQRKIFLVIFLASVAGILFFEKKFNLLSPSVKDDSGGADARPKNIFIWGALVFVFGALAYILVGKSPNPYDGSGFEVRHGLILPLGSSLIILALINGLLKNKIRQAVKIIILAVFITYNIYNYYTVDLDWYRQVGIIDGLHEKYEQGQLGESDIFIFYEKIPGYRWMGRGNIRAYEYTGYLYEATGNQKFVGTSANSSHKLDYMLMLAKNELNLNDKSAAERVKNIIITSDSKQEPTVKNWLKLKTADLFLGKNALRAAIKDIIGIKTEISARTPKENSWFDKSLLIQ